MRSPLAILLPLALAACGGGGGAPDAASDRATPDARAVCGGLGNLPCGADRYCDWTDDSCGAADQTGACQVRPQTCPELYQPVCGCDGAVHDNECFAAMAGVDLADGNFCAAPAGYFACGHLFCDAATSYCRRSLSDVVGLPDGWECVALPAACGATPDCACLAGEACDIDCTVTDLGLRLTCPGG